jgi:hypothetical protein
MEPQFRHPPLLRTALVDAVSRRIHHRPGLSVTRTGTLGSTAFGHPPGSTYVRVRASTLKDCVSAEALLADVSRLPALAWDQGWEIAGHGAAIDGFELPIFPALSNVDRIAQSVEPG